MKNILKKSLFIVMGCLLASAVSAADATFTMANIFDGNGLSFTVTTPTNATVSSNTSKSNAKAGKLGSDGHYFEIVLTNETFTAASINGYINTNDQSKNWAFQFSTDGGANWSAEVTQANDGNKTAHDIAVNVTIPAGANGFRVIRRAGTSTMVTSITLTLPGGGGGGGDPTVSSVTVSPASATLEINDTQQLTATVTATPSSADKTVTWTSSNPSVATVSESGLVTAVAQGTATITATSNLDNTKSGTCTVTVNTPAAPIPVTAIALSDATVAVGSTTTLTVTYTPADANTGKAISTWTSSNNAVATVANGVVTGISAGTATITATTEGGKTASCTVTVNVVAVTGVSLDKTSANLQTGGSITLTATVTPANASNKAITWSSSDPAVATVGNGVVTAIAAGSTTITAASVADPTKTATCTVTVTAGPPVPPTTLALHEPEVYEAKTKDGGYGGQLVVNGGYEYEVFYAGRLDEGGTKLTIHIDPIDKSKGVTKNETNTSYEAIDGWFKGSGTDKGTSFVALEEFNKATSRCHTVTSSNTIEMHIQGYDQFSLYAADKKWNPSKPSDCKYFKVSIDGVEQTMTSSTDQTIRRFGITTGRHLIKITLVGDGNLFGGFSLRVPRQPKVKYLKGNDSAQVVLQTMDLKKILYTTKYNNIEGADTRLVWNGRAAKDIFLSKVNTDAQMIDTFQLSGHANCPVGKYAYDVIAYFNGVETNRVSGTFSVISDIKSLTGVNAEVYQGEEMDQIRFRYYALSADDVTLTWPNGQPQGVSGSGNSGTYVISGIPTVVNTYPYEITVAGADTVIKGELTVKELNYGQNPVLYLYKNDLAYTKDGTYHYLLGTTTGKWNFITRREKEDGLRSADQYSKYKWILISEDVDADNPEVLALARGEVALPVLNMKSFTYTPGRLEWGEPDNGSLTDEGRYITVYRADHPIFKALNKHKDDRIMVLDTVEGKGLMPINVNYDKTLCLATALTRDIDDYFGDGPEQTIMHEVQRPNGKKYICFPMGIEGSKHLTSDGKKLIDQTIKYLLSDEATIQAPSLAITEFKVGKYTGDIDEANHLITIPVLDKDSDLMKAATPTITLASPLTFVTPNSGETVDFSNWHYGVRYEVRDYTSRKYYNVVVRLYNPQGIDNIEAGTWLNIFDVYGRKVATTNQDIRTMDLPHGMYIVVTESGQTIKIMR